MKGFFKFTFASILGVLIGLVLFILIIIGIISASSQPKPVLVEANTVLFTDFANPIIDRAPQSPFEYFDPVSFEPESRLGLDMILENIKKAKENDNIPGIVLNLRLYSSGMATLNEIREALIDFKSDGKFIVCFADTYSQGAYYLASVADKIYMTPEGMMPFFGLSSEIIFYKDALDKLGIEIQVFKEGEYKGAVEPYLYRKLSKENRSQIQDYLNSLWGHMLTGIAESRNLSVDELNQLTDNMDVLRAEDALKSKLVDSLVYYDEFINIVKELTDTDPEDDIKTISFDQLDKVPVKKEVKGLIRDKIAVVYASGNIAAGNMTEGMIGADAYARAIRKARRDSSIKAIVLRINSPGGSGQASDVIWREVKLAAEVKPMIVSMGDVAASGGYYIAAPADKIIASPNTITGSIGVFGLFPNAQKFMNEKLGLTTEIVKTNDHADFGTPFKPLDDKKKAVFSKQIEDFYKRFVSIVAEGRDMEIEEVDKIARGHVYSGYVAKELGLIDEFGGLKKAVEVAAKDADLEVYRIVKLPEKQDPIEKILEEFTGNSYNKYLKEELGNKYYYYKKFKEFTEMEGIQARMPYDINVK